MQYHPDDAINPSFYCPITGALMEDPVIDSEGNTYERTAIEAWLDRHNTSPITRNRLTKDDLRPNRALKNSIEEVMASQGRIPSRNPLLAPAVSGSAPIEFPTLQLTLNSKLMDAVQLQPLLDKKITDDSYCEFLLHASVLAPPIKERVPSDIVLVVDVSGSMGNEATTKGIESSGLCLLDIVKHAVKTIISVLDDRDRLSLVSFSNAATKIFDLMTMDSVGKENALNLLEKLEPGGMTNLWDGLQTGMNILKNRVLPGGSKFGNNASVLLLTDGEPNIEPPRGFLPMMKRYAAQNGGRYPGIISVFGFGYSLDSHLLRRMAMEGGGMYAFIPDSGFVGTAFVNALANILATVTLDAELTLEYDENNSEIMIFKDGIPGFFPVEQTRGPKDGLSKVKISLGSVQTGQSKDMVIRVSVPSDFVEKKVKAGEPWGPIIRGTLTYHNNKGHTYTHGSAPGDQLYDPTGGRAFVAETKTTRERFRELMRDRPGGDDAKSSGGEGKDAKEAKDAKDEPEVEEPPIIVRTDGLFIHLRSGAEKAVGEAGIVASDSATRVPSETEEKVTNLEIDSQYLRLWAVNCLADFDSVQLPDEKAKVAEFIPQLEAWVDRHKDISPRLNVPANTAAQNVPDQGSPVERMRGLLEDMKGQVTEAIYNMEYIRKWGRHYVPSLGRSHALQQCNNFKDPGIQFYGGALFRDIRDFADDEFCNLPAPVPKEPKDMYSYGQGGAAYGGAGSPGPAMAAAPAPISMASYNSRDQPCFHGDCKVSMFDGTAKVLKDVRKGDVLLGGGIVKCIVRTDCYKNRARLVSINQKTIVNGNKNNDDNSAPLLVTPWHPIKLSKGSNNDSYSDNGSGKWVFPADVACVRDVPCEAVYSLLVDAPQSQTQKQISDDYRHGCSYSSSVIINGVECAALAHGIEGDDVVSHPFFGTTAVVKALQQCAGWTDGLVRFRCAGSESSDGIAEKASKGCLVRDVQTGLVMGFALDAQC